MKYSCTELNYLLNSVCFGDKSEALSLLILLRVEVLKLVKCCSFNYASFVDDKQINSHKHQLVGSSGLLGLYSLSDYLRKMQFCNNKFETNYYMLTKSLKNSIFYLDDLVRYLDEGQSFQCDCHR